MGDGGDGGDGGGDSDSNGGGVMFNTLKDNSHLIFFTSPPPSLPQAYC